MRIYASVGWLSQINLMRPTTANAHVTHPRQFPENKFDLIFIQKRVVSTVAHEMNTIRPTPE